jgi:hypothetical protein
MAMGVLCACTASAAVLGIHLRPTTSTTTTPTLAGASLDTDRMNALMRANRDMNRTAPKPSAAAEGTATAPKPAAPPKPKAPAIKPTPAPKPAPKPNPLTAPLPAVKGLSTSQTRNAWAVVLEGHNLGISQRGQIIAMATALQESQLINYRRAVDHDSLGIFQQRPSMGWGTRQQLTDPMYAAKAFYRVLVQYKGSWGCLTCAAQRVQGSAYPSAYAKHERFATAIVTLLDRRF